MSGAARKNWADEESDSSDDEDVVEETTTPAPAAEVEETPSQNKEYVGKERKEERGRGGNDRSRGGRGRGDGKGRGDRAPRERNTKPPAHGPFKAFMSNLSFKVTESNLYDYFGGNDCPATQVVLRMERENPTKFDGSAIITFASAEHLSKSMNAHGHDFMGRNVHIRVYEDFSDRGHRSGRNDRVEEKNWNRGEGQDRSKRGEKTAIPASTSSGTRPKLDLKPRTAPLNNSNTTANSAIFGEGKARVEVNAVNTETKPDKEKSDKYAAKASREKKEGKNLQPTTVFNKAVKVSLCMQSRCMYLNSCVLWGGIQMMEC